MTYAQAFAYAIAAWENYLEQRITAEQLTAAWRPAIYAMETDYSELQLRIMAALRRA